MSTGADVNDDDATSLAQFNSCPNTFGKQHNFVTHSVLSPSIHPVSQAEASRRTRDVPETIVSLSLSLSLSCPDQDYCLHRPIANGCYQLAVEVGISKSC